MVTSAAPIERLSLGRSSETETEHTLQQVPIFLTTALRFRSGGSPKYSVLSGALGCYVNAVCLFLGSLVIIL